MCFKVIKLKGQRYDLFSSHYTIARHIVPSYSDLAFQFSAMKLGLCLFRWTCWPNYVVIFLLTKNCCLWYAKTHKYFKKFTSFVMFFTIGGRHFFTWWDDDAFWSILYWNRQSKHRKFNFTQVVEFVLYSFLLMSQNMSNQKFDNQSLLTVVFSLCSNSEWPPRFIQHLFINFAPCFLLILLSQLLTTYSVSTCLSAEIALKMRHTW